MDIITRYAWAPEASPDLVDLGRERLREAGPDVLLGDLIACDRFDVMERLGEIEVPTLKGRSKLVVPRGAQSGTILRMRGQGLPRLDGYGVGSQNVRVVVEVPTKLDAEQEELLRRYTSMEQQQVGTRQRSFWNKVREIFE